METMNHFQQSKKGVNLRSRIRRNPKLKTVLLTVLFGTGYAWFISGTLAGEHFLYRFLSNWVLILCMLLAGLGIAYKFFIPYLKDKPVKELKKKILSTFGLFMVGVLVACILINIVALCITRGIDGMRMYDFIDLILSINYWKMLREYLVWVLAAMAFFFYMTWYGTATREQHLREENLLYKYKNLKTQVNPHFLFNSLNTLSELVYEDAGKADRYIQRLSGIYRYILDYEETDLVLLPEEIEFVKQYFDLQKERAEGKIQLDIEVQHAEKFKIIPVSLQILVENALKHNSASEENPLQIRMYTTDRYVVVSNTLQRKNILNEASFQSGLSNLAARMKLITGREMVVNQENNLFTVQLPLVEIQE